MFVQENVFQIDVCEMAAILCRTQGVNILRPSDAYE